MQNGKQGSRNILKGEKVDEQGSVEGPSGTDQCAERNGLKGGISTNSSLLVLVRERERERVVIGWVGKERRDGIQSP